jgi:hypothetical protein
MDYPLPCTASITRVIALISIFILNSVRADVVYVSNAGGEIEQFATR